MLAVGFFLWRSQQHRHRNVFTLCSSLLIYFMPNLLKFLPILFLSLLLGACQGTLRQITDCKQGDWGVIGAKDGEKGLLADYDARRKFCSYVDSDKIKAESMSQYQSGWERGNFQFWKLLGVADGRVPQAVSFFSVQLHSEKITENKTPANQAAYVEGWRVGNADYWRGLGDQDGVAGKPASIEKDRVANAGAIEFNLNAYQEGWRNGNQAYWTRLGFLDAQAGISDNQFSNHAQAAHQQGVLVREDAYRAAWDLEIIAYWKKTAWNDATSGWDMYMRRVDAKKRGLKFVESEYVAMWESRLQQYWRDAGKDDGYGKANQWELRSANARNDKVFIAANSRENYQQAWNAENVRYCSPMNAFQFGRQSQYFAVEVCLPDQQGRARHAFENGEKYTHVLRERDRVEHELRHTMERRNELAIRLRRLESELRRDYENKDRVITKETESNDKRRERECSELRRAIGQLNREYQDLEHWRYLYNEQLEQLERGI